MKNTLLGTLVLCGAFAATTGALAQTNTQNSQSSSPSTTNQQQTTPSTQQTSPSTTMPSQSAASSSQPTTPVQGATLPAGTQISIRADQNIDSKQAQAGQTFDAEVQNNVNDANGNLVIPK